MKIKIEREFISSQIISITPRFAGLKSNTAVNSMKHALSVIYHYHPPPPSISPLLKMIRMGLLKSHNDRGTFLPRGLMMDSSIEPTTTHFAEQPNPNPSVYYDYISVSNVGASVYTAIEYGWTFALVARSSASLPPGGHSSPSSSHPGVDVLFSSSSAALIKYKC